MFIIRVNRRTMAKATTLENIDRYINGLLSDHEIDILWEELIQNPSYLVYIETLQKLRDAGSELDKPG